jgi:hypothetical protein
MTKTSKINKWLKSPEGKEAIKNSLNKAEVIIKKLKKLSRIDPKILYEPFI